MKNSLLNTFAKNLRKLMDSGDLKQPDVEAATKISQSTISRYLSGKTVPKLKDVESLAEFFRMRPGKLLGWDQAGERVSALMEVATALEPKTSDEYNRYIELLGTVARELKDSRDHLEEASRAFELLKDAVSKRKL